MLSSSGISRWNSVCYVRCVGNGLRIGELWEYVFELVEQGGGVLFKFTLD